MLFKSGYFSKKRGRVPATPQPQFASALHLDNKKSKATLCNQIVKDCPLSKSDIVLRSARCFCNGMILFHMAVTQHTYHDWLKVVVKTVAKRAQQNQLSFE